MSKVRSMTALMIPLIAMLLVVPGWTHGVAAAPRTDPREPPLAAATALVRKVYTEKILAVLDHKVTDPASKGKAAEKLATLSDRQLRLMAALSDRVLLVGDGLAEPAVVQDGADRRDGLFQLGERRPVPTGGPAAEGAARRHAGHHDHRVHGLSHPGRPEGRLARGDRELPDREDHAAESRESRRDRAHPDDQ